MQPQSTITHVYQRKPRFRDLAGKRFGRWTAVSYAGRNAHRETFWHCRCDCGTTGIVASRHLSAGSSRSCGCLHRELSRDIAQVINLKHGATRTKEYRAWSQLKSRCFNPNNRRYVLYGGRGITVCARWRDSFENFLADVGPAPSPKHSLDRIANDGNYEPGNCRWATTTEQARNTRANAIVSHGGRPLPISEWAALYDISAFALRGRLMRGWSMERALTEPVHARH